MCGTRRFLVSAGLDPCLEFLDTFGFEYEFMSSTECYPASRFDETLLAVLRHYDAVMDLNAYQLYPSFRDLFTTAGEGSKEVIFDYQHVKGVNGWNAWIWLAPHSMGANIDVAPTRALVDRFAMKDGLPASQSPLYDPAPPTITGSSSVAPTRPPTKAPPCATILSGVVARMLATSRHRCSGVSWVSSDCIWA